MVRLEVLIGKSVVNRLSVFERNCLPNHTVWRGESFDAPVRFEIRAFSQHLLFESSAWSSTGDLFSHDRRRPFRNQGEALPVPGRLRSEDDLWR
jgi:hypothetical protein